MAALDDLVSTIKGGVTNLGSFVVQAMSPGVSLSTTVSPTVTMVTTIGSSASAQVIAANKSRRHIEFYNPVAASSTVFLMPANLSAANNQGIPIGGGSSYIPQTWLNVTCAWNAISSTSGTSVLTVVEFF